MNANFNLGMEDRAEKLNSLLLEQDADFTLVYIKVWKNNAELEGYVLRSSTNNCAPTVYYDSEWYNQDDAAVVSYLINMYKKHACQIDVSSLTDKDYILSHIKPRMVSENNLAELEERGIAHIKFLDMYILFYVTVDEFSDAMASMQVTDSLLHNAEITLDEAYSSALFNLEKEAEVKTLAEVLCQDMGVDPGFIGGAELPMWVCSTKNKIQGAATMLCKSVLETLEHKIGGKVAILPSSIHEFIAVPYESEEQFSMFKELVQQVNNTEVSVTDKLTDSVYFLQNAELKLAV